MHGRDTASRSVAGLLFVGHERPVSQQRDPPARLASAAATPKPAPPPLDVVTVGVVDGVTVVVVVPGPSLAVPTVEVAVVLGESDGPSAARWNSVTSVVISSTIR